MFRMSSHELGKPRGTILPQFLARPIVSALQRSFDAVGFELRCIRPATLIPDAEFYRPMFQPWLSPEWRARLRADDPHSVVPLAAKYLLYTTALDATMRCDGPMAECGTYKGGTAKLLASLAPQRALYVFDTFAGMPQTDSERDLHKQGDFSDTSLSAVRDYLGENENAVCIPGFVPDSLSAVSDQRFSFVHIDLDIYFAIKGACEFFYPRMQRGGVMLFDDYGYPSCPGARQAVEEFFADKAEVPQAMETAQCVVRKL